MAENTETSFQDSAVDMAAIPEETPPEQLPAKLEKLKASATKEYSLKNYNAAAEYYSEAAEVQDQINGEMSTENGDLLYQYGRCLYKVAVASSDVLGGKVAGPSEPKRKKRKVTKAESSANGEGSSSLINDAIKSSDQKLAEDVVEAAVEQKDDVKEEKPAESSNPFFQITGDDNFTDSEDEEEGDGEAEEEEDDFATAYEILDMARILLSRKVDELQSAGKGKSKEESAEVRQVKERLADTHDLQAEISLENERFQDAIKDTRDALALKLELYPTEDPLVTEAHYKLSLALEFASVTSTQEDAEGQSTVAQVDEEMRKDAAKEMELAIASCRAKVTKEESKLSNLSGTEAEHVKKEVTNVKEMIVEMEQRLKDLQAPAASLSALQGLGPAGAPGSEEDAMRGILASLLGESKADQAKRIEQATAQANDLTGMVKKKKPKPADSVVDGNGKRKAEDEPTSDGASTNGTGKKVKISSMKPEVIGEDGGKEQ
ncbi:NASP-related protein sim3 [Pseudocercospora fuligena]|uniref:NASP-related protein sim3 n=1 Tax=Pseudocercospora fuligena TaxID=685502 RepID=A0A8H6VII2_9PEZI|nr:NASP-related protein sim3 [Pseudocercospora fuligena]